MPPSPISTGRNANTETSIHHPLTAPPTTTTAGVALYLPRGPILNDPHQDASNVSILQSILPYHVVQVNYRCGTSNKYPTPIHDVATGYDWIVSHLLPKRAIARAGRSEHVGRIAVCGELVGGQLATMLALTECRAGEPGVVAAAVGNAIVDWVAFQNEEAQVWSPVKKSPLPTTTTTPSNTALTTAILARLRAQLFRKSAQYYDPFASPALFFRTAGSEIPEDVDVDVEGEEEEEEEEEEKGPLDDFDELARFERGDFLREQRALSAVRGLLEPSLLSDGVVPPAKKRKTSRRYPSKALGLRLPRFLLSAGVASPLSSQSEELAHLLRQSFARQAKSAGSKGYYDDEDDGGGSDVSEDMVRHEQYPGLGLWDNSQAGRSRMRAAASWMASALAR
ncbi:alpha beta-hydrolase [Lecanosticta acicola]|uniref:Alpha beta-hydrolase n=1 Tax=Lecanosticta acicola TaxID=111012 RepID=A0AAI8YWQ9_9PEZI|nr:alpha beta-hydrolase [Lecanosticta acicola]